MKVSYIAYAALMICSVKNVYAIELQTLLNDIANSPEKSAHFTETRRAYFLDSPLVSKGSIEFKAPDSLIKRLTHPKMVEQRIEGDVVSLTQSEGSINVISLSAHRELALGINAMRWVLMGNMLALKETFELTLKEYKQLWQLELAPKNPDDISYISNISLIGKSNHITKINIQHTNGDTTKIEIYDHK